MTTTYNYTDAENFTVNRYDLNLTTAMPKRLTVNGIEFEFDHYKANGNGIKFWIFKNAELNVTMKVRNN